MNRFRIAGDVVLSQFPDDQGVLLDISKKRHHRFNATAAFLWTAIENGSADEDTLVVDLVREFEISEPRARASVQHFTGELRSYGLIEEVPAPIAS